MYIGDRMIMIIFLFENDKPSSQLYLSWMIPNITLEYDEINSQSSNMISTNCDMRLGHRKNKCINSQSYDQVPKRPGSHAARQSKAMPGNNWLTNMDFNKELSQ